MTSIHPSTSSTTIACLPSTATSSAGSSRLPTTSHNGVCDGCASVQSHSAARRNANRAVFASPPDACIHTHALTHARMHTRTNAHMHACARTRVSTRYDEFGLSKVVAVILHFVANDLSSVYFEAAKDRLYCTAADSFERRSAQSCVHHILMMLTKAIAPILPHTAEDIHEHTPYSIDASVFYAGWLDVCIYRYIHKIYLCAYIYIYIYICIFFLYIYIYKKDPNLCLKYICIYIYIYV